MIDNICMQLIKGVADSQKEFIVIFKEHEPVFTNSFCNTFFGVNSFEQYKERFGPFLENFVPHPSYFHKEKIQDGRTWFESISELDDMNRVVSMMNSTFDPHAFAVNVMDKIDDYTIVTFEDITQTLIKRIMIQNNANIDAKSGAYDKTYFLQVMQSYEDAAKFNEKSIALTTINLTSQENLSSEILTEFATNFKASIRQDDMLVHWSDEKFLLVYLVDNEENAKQVTNKLQNLSQTRYSGALKCSLTSSLQKENENIEALIKRVMSIGE